MAESKAAAVRRINDTIRYMQISVFAVDSSLGTRRIDLSEEVDAALADVKGVTTAADWTALASTEDARCAQRSTSGST